MYSTEWVCASPATQCKCPPLVCCAYRLSTAPNGSLWSSLSAIKGLDHLTALLKNSVSSRGYESNMNWETGEGHPFEYFVYGAACSEVEIDCLTGAHKVSTDREGLPAELRYIYFPHIPATWAPERHHVWDPGMISLYFQKKMEARHLPWCSVCFPRKQLAASILHFPCPFKWNQEKVTPRKKHSLWGGFHVDCWHNQQSWPLAWNAIIWHSWRISQHPQAANGHQPREGNGQLLLSFTQLVPAF